MTHEQEETRSLDLDLLAARLNVAWRKYTNLFGEHPHGTLQQLRAMLEFLPEPEAVQTLAQLVKEFTHHTRPPSV